MREGGASKARHGNGPKLLLCQNANFKYLILMGKNRKSRLAFYERLR